MAKRASGGHNLVLDLGTHSMRLLRLESAQPGEVHIKEKFVAGSPREFVVSTFIEFPIIDSIPVQTAIKSLVSQTKISYDNLTVLLPDHAALINLMVAPPHYSKKEALEAIREDFAPIMPLPIDNWHIIHQTIGPWEDDEITIAIAAIKANLIEIGGIIQQTGLNPQIFDINYFNVANLIEHYLIAEESKGKNIALVHLGNETTSIGIFRDGQIRTFLNRPIGGYDFTKQISKHFHVPDVEADQFKKNEIFFLPEVSPEQEGLYNYTVIKNVFSILAREIFSGMESFLTKFREFNIHEVILSGGGANFQNLRVLLSANLNIPVRDVSDFYKLYINGTPAEAPERNGLASACGAFLRE